MEYVIARVPVTGYIEYELERPQGHELDVVTSTEFDEIINYGDFVLEKSDPLSITLRIVK